MSQLVARLLPKKKPKAIKSILGPEVFRATLQQERARTDRNGDVFCLLTFKFPDHVDLGQSASALASVLDKRLRCTDVGGWLEDGQEIAAVLPSTPAWGAWRVADDVCLLMPEDSEPPSCTVYSYPTNWSQPDGSAPGIPNVASDKPVRAMEALFMVPLPWWKRSTDIALSLCGLALTLPVTCAAAAAVTLSSPGPILFKQKRSGLGGKPFFIYKFRSMVINAEEQRDGLLELNEQDGPAFKIADDPRITTVGRFLRKTNIDELPQLWNILRGDMTIVGPRPLPCHEISDCLTWQRRRSDVTPGLTCIWQIDGRSPRVSFPEWMRMDIRYLLKRNLWHDLKLIVRTGLAVLKRQQEC